MKKFILVPVFLLSAMASYAGGLHFSVGFHLPLPVIVAPPVVVSAPPPVVYLPPAPPVVVVRAPVCAPPPFYSPAPVYYQPAPVVYYPAPGYVPPHAHPRHGGGHYRGYGYYR